MRRVRGVALLTALLAVALAAMLIAMLLDDADTGAARAGNLQASAQADAYARGLEAWALDVLRREAALDQGRDSNNDAWALGLPATPVEGGVITASLRDASGCFNVNNLAPDGTPNALARARFERLLAALKLDPGIADRITDFIDGDSVPEPRGAEDPAYAAVDPPTRAANRALIHASELRAVVGLDRDAYAALAPFVCALPGPSALNLNTASIPVLMALDARITEPLARRLYRDGRADWSSVEAFADELGRAGVPFADLSGTGLDSRFFIARADVVMNEVRYTRSALLERGRGAAPDRVHGRVVGVW